MSNTVILYGPKGTGKTRFSQQIAEHYGCVGITDNWDREEGMIPNHLHITTRDYSNASMVMHDSETSRLTDVRCVSIEQALKAIGASMLEGPVRNAEDDIAMQIREQVNLLQGTINKAARMGIKCEITVLEHMRTEIPHEVPSLHVTVLKVL